LLLVLNFAVCRQNPARLISFEIRQGRCKGLRLRQIGRESVFECIQSALAFQPAKRGLQPQLFNQQVAVFCRDMSAGLDRLLQAERLFAEDLLKPL